jgi:hypothetical protein
VRRQVAPHNISVEALEIYIIRKTEHPQTSTHRRAPTDEHPQTSTHRNVAFWADLNDTRARVAERSVNRDRIKIKPDVEQYGVSSREAHTRLNGYPKPGRPRYRTATDMLG